MRPLASISLDLDNQWSYMKTHGDPGWESFPSYLEGFIPYLLGILEGLDLRITVFIVGQDAALEKNAPALRLISKHGHEVGNHSFHHEPWLHLKSKGQIKKEIAETDTQIRRVTGQHPRGFRGPGFSWSVNLLEVLAEHNYLYDASTLPMYIGGLARIYYFRTTDLTRDEMRDRKQLFGTFQDGFRPARSYQWHLPSGGDILEMPVTTMPLFKIPFHLSYLIYLSRISEHLMRLYLKGTLALCLLTRTEPSFLLHPLDLLGKDQVPELAFFPGMDLRAAQKKRLFETVLNTLGCHYRLVNMSTHALALLDNPKLPIYPAKQKDSSQRRRHVDI